MKNNRGSILIITTAFVFGFTALGIASIYLAGQENQFAQREVLSTQAFWLANGGMEEARGYLSSGVTPTTLNNNLGNGTINISAGIPLCSGCTQYKWNVTSASTVNNNLRTIQATISQYNPQDLSNALSFSGTVFTQQNGTISAPPQTGVYYTTQQIFNGLSFNQLELPSNSNIQTQVGAGVYHPSSTATNPVLYIIDTQSTASSATVQINSNKDFYGIIWIFDSKNSSQNISVTINGNISLYGAVFVEGGTGSTVDENSAHTLIDYDLQAISLTLADIMKNPALSNNALVYTSWQET